MKKLKKLEFITIISIVLIVILAAVWVAYDFHKKTVWKYKVIDGYIIEYELYNDFPNQELLIYFSDGNYLHVTGNPFWAYSQVINLNLSQSTIINYKENLNHNIRVVNVEGYYFEVEE